MRTIETVRDMDRIRAALGVRRVSFYGYSYGSYLGQVFATTYPRRLHRMVLDSNVDPAKVWYAAAGPQIRAQQRVLDYFFAWIARHAEVYRLGRTAAAVRRTFLREQRDLLRRPARGVLGPSELSDAFVPALYLQVAWPSVARAFARLARRDDPGPLIRIWRLGTRGSDNSYAAFLATYCTDAPGYDDPQRLLSDAARLARVAPQIAWRNTWQTAPCLSWGADPGPRVVVEPRRVRALLVGQTLDGATPFADSLAVRAILPRSRLVAIRGGTTHSSTPDLSGRCANLWLAAYLRSGALPPRRPGRRADVTCPAPPPPRPGSAIAGQAPGSLTWLRLLTAAGH
jgi:pimeloyl-ACP methyl ester carboxylesterase